MIWLTADTHFGHTNVLKYCNRPYANLDEMHAAIIAEIQSKVQPEDTLYVLGDFSLNKKWSRDIVPLLPGKKILIPGNHDACFKWKNKNNLNKINEYLLHGWYEIHQTLHITLKDGTYILLSHLPYNDLRYPDYAPINQGTTLLHGHSHGHYQKNGRMIDVGIDAHGMSILSEDDVIRLIKDPRINIDSPLTSFYNNKKQ